MCQKSHSDPCDFLYEILYIGTYTITLTHDLAEIEIFCMFYGEFVDGKGCALYDFLSGACC